MPRENSGRKANQRMKHYILLQYLLDHSDEAHTISANTIKNHFKDNCKISAERRSIYRDILEINAAHIMREELCDFEEALEILEEEPSRAMIQYKSRKGYYVAHRPISTSDARLICECIYTSRFVSVRKAKALVKGICSLMSENHENDIKHDMFAIDRLDTNADSVFDSVDIIHKAMASSSIHSPEKIRFKYIKYALTGTKPKPVDRRRGVEYTVSPYQILIDNGNYYLLAIDDGSKSKQLRTYRIDRMHDIKLTGERREATAETKDLDVYLDTYTQRVFSMYGGERVHVEIQFIESLLDTIVDRFGAEIPIYSRVDDKHYKVNVEVEVSPMFYGWLAGLGRKVKLLSPSRVVEGYKEHINKISGVYD